MNNAQRSPRRDAAPADFSRAFTTGCYGAGYQRLRILIDYRPALRERTGVGEYVYRLVRALATEVGTGTGEEAPGPRTPSATGPTAHAVTLFSSSWKDRLTPGDAAGLAVIDQRVPVGLLNLLWHRLEWPSVELLTRTRFDVVHSAHPLMLPARDAARVVTIHDLDFLAHPERTRAEIRRDYPALVRSHAGRADAILVPSAYTAQQVERLLDVPPARIAICPHGAPPWPARDRRPDDGHILFLGTLEPRKNVGTLLRAYASLLERRADTPRLVLGGSATPAATPWLESLRRPPLLDRARHLGYVPPNERHALYLNARLLVLPSLDEGFGLPVLEAMTVGVPVVASNRGALPDLLGDAGLLVDPEDGDGLADAMERMLFDESLARQAIARGLERARRHTWSAAARASLEAYSRAVETHRGRRAHPHSASLDKSA